MLQLTEFEKLTVCQLENIAMKLDIHFGIKKEHHEIINDYILDPINDMVLLDRVRFNNDFIAEIRNYAEYIRGAYLTYSGKIHETLPNNVHINKAIHTCTNWESVESIIKNEMMTEYESVILITSGEYLKKELENSTCKWAFVFGIMHYKEILNSRKKQYDPNITILRWDAHCNERNLIYFNK